MQTEPAFLDDLIRSTWNGQVVWEPAKIDQRSGFSADFSKAKVRAFTTYRYYQVSPGASIAEVDHHVEKQNGPEIYREIEGPRTWKKELWDAIGFKSWEVDSSQRELLLLQGYFIRFDGADPRGQNILYEEPDRRAVLYVEMPASGSERWQASARSLRKWTDPVDVEIDPTKQDEIRSRIVEWSRSHNSPVKFC